VPDAKINPRADALADKPDMAVVVTTIFALWGEIEYFLAQLLMQILHADIGPAVAIYETLRSQTMQRKALEAAAAAALSPDDYDVFEAAISLVESVSTPRHQLAHWLWALCEQRPDLLALVDPKKMKSNMGRARRSLLEARRSLLEARRSLLEFDPGAPSARDALDDRRNKLIIDPKFVVGYSKADLENVERDLREVRGIVAVVGHYFDHDYLKTLVSSNRITGRAFQAISDEEFRRQLRDGLVKLPRLSEALDGIKKRRSKDSAEQARPPA
jgi:hypothetical protein